MDSPSLILQDVIGDAIKAQLLTDGITAEVVTNPTQGGAYPYVVIGQDAESSQDTNKDKLKSSIACTVLAHSDSMVEVKQVAASIVKAIGPDGASLDLGAEFYEVERELEAKDITPEYRSDGDIYHALIRVRYLISHV